MKITYINHSGFLIETKDCYYIFDYYKGELPLLDKKKEVIVFCSHFHKDHFNPVIFEILDDMGMTYQAILAKDIRTGKIEEIMLIRSSEDLEKFKEIYEITEEISKEY